MFKYFSLIFSTMSVFSVENSSQVEVNNKSKFDLSGKSYFSKIKFKAELGIRSGNGVKTSEADSETTRLLPSVGLTLPLVGNFSINLLSSITDDSRASNNTINRDEDIKDANGKDIRLVERKLSYDYNEGRVLEASLTYDYHFNSYILINPFIGFSKSDGNIEAKRYDMTDREKPILFSKHNRYYLTQTSDFTTKSITVGSNIYFVNNYYLTAKAIFNRTSFKNSRRDIQINGEDIAFNDSDFAFAFAKENEGESISKTSVFIGFGMYF